MREYTVRTCSAVLKKKSGKGRQRNMCMCMMGIPRFSRRAWAENIANMASLYKYMGNFKVPCITLIHSDRGVNQQSPPL